VVELRKEDVLGYDVAIDDVDTCSEIAMEWVREKVSNRYFVCANPHSLHVAESDALFKQALREADMVTPDGVGIVIASRIHGGNISDRVTGSDMFFKVNEKLDAAGGGKCFFLGRRRTCCVRSLKRCRWITRK